MKSQSNPFWGEGEGKDFGKVAIEYAAGEDVILDAQFVQYECLVNEAHIIMLYKQHIISQTVTKKLLQGLEEIKKLDKAGKFILQPELEDVHSNVEQYLIQKLGIGVGGYLRLGIARNDQVYTDTRLFMREKILSLSHKLLKLLKSLIDEAAKHTETVMPGYTHLRISQPITYGHWLVAKAYHFFDDLCAILNLYYLVNQCPLGIFEMAGTHLPIDRRLTAKFLGFDGITPNSLYIASQRGEIEAKLIAEFSFLALHIRRTMNEVILFTTNEFELFTIDDLYTTGGTAQPNLKNPDTVEVVRANMASMLPSLIETIMIMDVLSSGYNRDSQQTKPILFQAIGMMEKTLPIVTGILSTLMPRKEQMEKIANLNFATAPDVAVQLAVKGGVSFREAYKVVKELIKGRYLKTSFSELTPELVSEVSQKVLGRKIRISKESISEVASARACAFSHTSEGGPAQNEVKKMIADLARKIENKEKYIEGKRKKIEKGYDLLEKEIKQLMK